MKPLILDYAEKRKGDTITIYNYDFNKSLNVIEVNGKIKPFIDSKREDVSLLTKTKVRSESDDDEFTLLELNTKTLVKQERDDESFNNI